MKHLLFLVIVTFFLYSCNNSKTSSFKNGNLPIDNIDIQSINIKLTDSAFRHVDNLLHTESYTILSNDEPLGVVERIIIEDSLIYILDNMPKIVCFNKKDGSIKWKINNRGEGPEEYGEIMDFTIDRTSKLLIAYDGEKRRLTKYDLLSGEYISNITIFDIIPKQIAFANGGIFFDNHNHMNYPDKKELHYSLLYTETGSKINKSFFPHNQISDYNFNYGDGHPFFYEQDMILYNPRFSNIVFEIIPKGLKPLYKINLPDSLPLKIIEDGISPHKLIESNYSWGISNIFECCNILYFWFTKNGRYNTVFYDLQNDKLIYGGNQVSNIPTKDLLVYYPISGVHNGTFFSLVEPFTIIEKRESAPDLFPENLMKVKEEDNPVLFFYKPVHDSFSVSQ